MGVSYMVVSYHMMDPWEWYTYRHENHWTINQIGCKYSSPFIISIVYWMFRDVFCSCIYILLYHMSFLLRFFIGPSMTVQQRKDEKSRMYPRVLSGAVAKHGHPDPDSSSSDSHQGEAYSRIPVAFFSCIRWLGGGFIKIGEMIQFDDHIFPNGLKPTTIWLADGFESIYNYSICFFLTWQCGLVLNFWDQ